MSKSRKNKVIKIAVIAGGVLAATFLAGRYIMKNTGFVWNMMWNKYQDGLKKVDVHLSIKPDFDGKMAVYDSIVTNRTEANINTHRVIYLPQDENGVISVGELTDRLDGNKKIKITGELKTGDGKAGIADAVLSFGSHEYEIVFTELPFYDRADDTMYETGGILTADLTVDGHKILKENLLCTADIVIGDGAVLEVQDGATLVTAHTRVHGTLNGFATGNVFMEDGGEFNGSLLIGSMTVSGNVTLTGMFIGEQLKAEDNAVLLMKEFGGLFTSADLGKNVTLRFQDGEPLFMGVNAEEWTVDKGQNMSTGPSVIGENSTGGSWYISYTKTPTDMLGRLWTETLDGCGALRAGIGGLGYVKNEPDLKLEVVDGTEHNFAMMIMNKYPITHVKGDIEVYVNEGIACPPEDAAAIAISELKEREGEAKTFDIDFNINDAGYIFSSSEKIAIQTVMKPLLKKADENVSDFGWKVAAGEDGYVFYGYTGEETNHWTGPTGTEECIVYVHRR